MASFFNLILDTTAPAGVTLALNDDARYTTKASITAKIGCEDAETTGYQMKIWGGVDGAATEDAAAWVNFAATKEITLTTGDGKKTVNLKVRDDVGNESAVVTKEIILDTAVPVVTVTGPDKSKISKVATFNVAAISFACDVDFVEYKVKVVPATTSLQDAGVVALREDDLAGIGLQSFNHCIEHEYFLHIMGRSPFFRYYYSSHPFPSQPFF